MVFDLAGSIAKKSASIISALKQSDVVIVPISNEIKSLVSGVNTILEVAAYTQSIIVVATKLEKQQKEVFSSWVESKDYLNIKKMVDAKVPFDVPVVPLKLSKVFDVIFEKEMSIRELTESGGLSAYHYKEISKQFNDIYDSVGAYQRG